MMLHKQGLIKLGWFIALLFTSSGSACVLKVQVNDFPPYSYPVADSWKGSRVVLSQRLATKLNCQLQFIDVPWGRALMLLQQGELDLIFNLSKTAEREQTLWFVAAHHRETLVIGVSEQLTDWLQLSSIEELRHFSGTIAVTQGSYLGLPFEQFRQEPAQRQKIVSVPHRKAKNELVLKGRAQAVVEDRDYLQYAIDNFPEYRQMVITPLVLSETLVYLAVSRQSPWFNRRLELEQAVIELQKAELWPDFSVEAVR